MLNAIGFGAAGIRAGSLVATAQSVAMGGAGALTGVASGAALAAVALPVALTGAVMGNEYSSAQQNTLGDGDRPEALAGAARDNPWVLIWENWWHGVHFRLFNTRDEALAVSAGGLKIRRMIVCLDPDGNDVVNEHGQRNPWQEVDFQGENVLVDNTLRNRLRGWLNEFAA